MDNINPDNVYNNLDKLYDEISTPSMKWEPVYQFYINKFSVSYLKGNDIYIGPSLIKSDVNIFKKLKTIEFLRKHYSDHPLAPKNKFKI